MTLATAADYGWIHSPSSMFAFGMEFGYSLTLVRGVSPSELFRIVGAEPQGVCEGLGELIHEQQEFLGGYDTWPDSFLAGAFTVQGEGGDWTLVLEFGGGLDMRTDIMEAISAETCAVSHSSNGGKPMDFFHWYEQGELRTTFEWPADRTGSTPDALNPLMLAVGLDPSGEGEPEVDVKTAVLALTERLTGVRVTQELLAEAEYHVGEMPEEPAEEWENNTTDGAPAH
ncbi:DUF6461 domain-containing protein [Streptomyces sp. NPDC091682]|uniref:DUF6461 domain-containing protein n=1 Tax=Streptomyces sp. NPDC091682 TaxID=3366005 RepID=UPI003822575B